MKTEYVFQLVTYVIYEHDLIFKTRRAEVTIRANGSKPLEKAIVAVPSTTDSQRVATEELYKVLVRHLGRQSKILPSSLKTHQIPETDEERNAIKRGFATLSVDAVLVKRYEENLPGTVRIDLASESPAIYQFHHAATQSDPVARFKEMFKVVEYFSGTKSLDERDRKRIRSNLGKTWDIPPSVVTPYAASSGVPERDTKYKIADEIVELRGKASHLRPDYGLNPTDPTGFQDFVKWAPEIEEIASFSLEFNSATSDSSGSPKRGTR